ncbi:MAG TPA: hypothetical protein VIM53_01620 [Candidatus Saccharimonadales bacterium]
MKTFDLAEASADFDALFASARRTMFKAEALQDYSAVDDLPSLHAWLAGDEQKAKELGKQDAGVTAWRERCLASPAKITRVHVVREPRTPYLDWEIEVIYKGSLLASGAEDVRIAPASKLGDAKLPAGDFWIFDGQKVLHWQYEDGVGKTIGATVWGEHDDISEFLKLRETLLSAAQPVV